jgi:hypothetical protein
MRSPADYVDELIRQWRQSPSGAIVNLRSWEQQFLKRCQELESTLDAFLAPPSRPTEAASGAERAWRWSRSGYLLFWIASALLCLGALAAGYLAAHFE